MIVRVEFSKAQNTHQIMDFCAKPKGTCLDSLHAAHITPNQIRTTHGLRVSFHYIDDKVLINHYGGKVCINAIHTVPGVIHVSSILEDRNFTYDMLKTDMTDKEMADLLVPFI
jgi:hypothetical protein